MSDTKPLRFFSREPDKDGCFSWEKLDLVDALKSEFK
jgi:hypothetical protein